MKFRNFTSLIHTEHANYQSDFMGLTETGAEAQFKRYCKEHDCLWGVLFDDNTGEQVATYTNK